ncbi:hypothetical protein [Halomicrobium urmianum]|nr:hypothetical protein [Halomicrobium urmianum]
MQLAGAAANADAATADVQMDRPGRQGGETAGYGAGKWAGREQRAAAR